MAREQTSGTIREYSSFDRSRDRLVRDSAERLSDEELLGVLVGRSARIATDEVASRVLAATGGVHGLTRLTANELARVAGVGLTRACRVLAAIELGRRTLMQPAARQQFQSPRDVAVFLLPQYGAHPVERFGVLLLDARNRLIRVRLVSVGSVDSAMAHPREVFREAAAGGATAIVVFHNHPSGDPEPSPDDLALTQRLVGAGRIMGIDVVDHLILADTRYCSFKETGRL